MSSDINKIITFNDVNFTNQVYKDVNGGRIVRFKISLKSKPI